MTDHEQRLQELGLSDWPHTIVKVCANQEAFSDADRIRLAKRLQTYARRHGIDTDQSATLKDVCVHLVQRVSSFAPEPLSPTDQLWFLENVADQLKLGTSRKDVQRVVQRRVEEHVVRDGWSWKHALVVVLAALAGSSGARGMQVPVCDQTACVAQPLDSVVAQLQTDAIAPQQLAWSLSDDLRDYMEERIPTTVTGPTTVAEPWIQDLTKSMNVYYKAVRDHEAGQLGRAQRSALETMLTDVEFAADNVGNENEISAVLLRKEIRALLKAPTVDNGQLKRVMVRYATWTSNTRAPSDLDEYQAKQKLRYPYTVFSRKEFTYDNIKALMKGNIPKDIILVPSFSPVTIPELNRMAGLRTFLMGMSTNKFEYFDDAAGQPFDFFFHDLEHMKNIYVNLATPRTGFGGTGFGDYDMDTYNLYFKQYPNIPSPNWEELEAEQMRYRTFIEQLKNTEDEDTIEQVEDLFFNLWHEHNIPINSLARMKPSSEYTFNDYVHRYVHPADGTPFSPTVVKLLFDHFRESPLATVSE